MGIPNVMLTGHSGLNAAKAGIATTGHNITNAGTEGYSRQRVLTETSEPRAGVLGHSYIGTGTQIARVERINDEYIEKQIRNSQRDLSHYEEKDLSLRQIDDIFNELNGDGLNRIVSRFFNEFRKLSDEPENPAVRQSVREASQGMVNDFRRIRKQVDEVRRHIDARIEGHITEVNALASELAALNQKIHELEVAGSPLNDLQDKRDVVLKKLGSHLEIATHKDKNGSVCVDIRGGGPLVHGLSTELLSVQRTPADDEGKPEDALDIRSTGSTSEVMTHRIRGGKLGALLETRDRTLSSILSRLDDMAYGLTNEVNEIHRQGVSSEGIQNILFFKPLDEKERAAELIGLSDDIQESVDNMATGFLEGAPGDNRVAVAISQLQSAKIMDDGHATLDEWYNSIVSDVGVVSSRNRFAMNQQKDIMGQLQKIRDQISGVSIDEETTNLLQFQHVFDASARVIQAADEMLKTVLGIKG